MYISLTFRPCHPSAVHLRAHGHSVSVADARVAAVILDLHFEGTALPLRRRHSYSPRPRAPLMTPSGAGAVHLRAERDAVGTTDADVAFARPLGADFARDSASGKGK